MTANFFFIDFVRCVGKLRWKSALVPLYFLFISPIFAYQQESGVIQMAVPAFALDGKTPQEVRDQLSNASSANFGIIAGSVWYDKDKNGLQNTDRSLERGVGSIRIELLDEQGLTLINAETDGSGFYQFQQLDLKPYLVHFVLPFGCQLSPKDAENDHKDAMDSDAEVDSGLTKIIRLSEEKSAHLSISAGINCQKIEDLLKPKY